MPTKSSIAAMNAVAQTDPLIKKIHEVFETLYNHTTNDSWNPVALTLMQDIIENSKDLMNQIQEFKVTKKDNPC